MEISNEITRRDVLRAAGLLTAGVGLAAEGVNAHQASAETIGLREIVTGLDGMSRVADEGNDPFGHGHVAAAVISSAFFCRENDLDAATRTAILALVEDRLLSIPIHASRPEEPAEQELVAGIVEDLDAGIASLRRSGHNIIFATISLKALREVPAAATATRVEGLRAMVRSFGAERASRASMKDDDSFVDLRDEKAFIQFMFAEYLRALDLYLAGRGHHGFAGHVLTVGHALIELSRMGYGETARKGLHAYRQFIQQARDGADLGGRRVKAPPPQPPGPLDLAYWNEQLERPADAIVSSHLIKYPYSFYALLKDLSDDGLREQVLRKLYYLSAVS